LNTVSHAFELLDLQGRKVKSVTLKPGTTIAFMELQDVYSGQYILTNPSCNWSKKVTVQR